MYRQHDFNIDENRLDQGRVKGESAVDVNWGKTELLTADILCDEAIAIDSYPSEIQVFVEVTKGDTVGEAD